MKLSDVMLVHAVDVKANADAGAIEASLNSQLVTLRKSAPGWEPYLVRKDRGNRAGRYAILLMTDIPTRRRSAGTPGPLAPLLESMKSLLETSPIAEPVEYHRVGSDIAGGDKLDPLPQVEVLGFHYIKVRQDRRDAFNRFVVDRLHPTVGNLRPDLRLIYYKPVRGEDPGNYLTVFALTVASRDTYWPKGQDSDVLKEAFKPMPPLAEELKAYLVEGSYATGTLAAAVFESREWADWVLVR